MLLVRRQERLSANRRGTVTGLEHAIISEEVDDGLHSPNERMSLDQYHRGTEMVIHFMNELAGPGR